MISTIMTLIYNLNNFIHAMMTNNYLTIIACGIARVNLEIIRRVSLPQIVV